MILKRLFLIGLIFTVVFSLLAKPASADGTQTWYLDNDGDPYPGWADQTMYRENMVEFGIIGLGTGDSIIWRSNEPAEVDVAFCSDPWNGRINLAGFTHDELKKLKVQIGYLEGDASGPGSDPTNFIVQGERYLNESDIKSIQYLTVEIYQVTFEIPLNSGFTIPQDCAILR